MEYYSLSKTAEKSTWLPIVFKGGYVFKQKIFITIYNFGMIRYILLKKLNNSLKNIINLYILFDGEDDSEDSSDKMSEILPKIETLRKILIEKYAAYMSETEIEAYLIKLERLEEKIDSKVNKKSRTR